MTMLTDSHSHIYLDQFDKDRDEVIQRAEEMGVGKIYMPNIDSETIDRMMETEERYKDTCFSMIGLHPCSVSKQFEKELYLMEEWLGKRKFSAIGEIGTDLYWDRSYWPEQQEALKVQLQLALDHNYPVVLHCRESIDETIDIVAPFAERGLKGVFHCFTGSLNQMELIRKMNFNIGIGGVATFKNGGLEEVVKHTDLSSMMLETDSPYLAPVPYRGKRNEPGYTRVVAEKVAEIKQINITEVIEMTSKATKELFNAV